MKAIQINQQQVKAYKNGATMFIIPITDKNISIQLDKGEFIQSAYSFECDWCKGKDANCTDCYGLGRRWDIDCESKKEFVAKYSPLQIDDEFFLEYTEYAEPFNFCNGNKIDFKLLDVCLDVEVKRIQNITLDECEKVCGYKDYRSCYNLLNVNYKGVYIACDNPYVFLITVKGKKKKRSLFTKR